MEVTANYGLFGHIVGNRPISKKHVEELIASIEENGWLHQPITVNERFEIIDGQHRFEALKALHQPIEYVVVDDSDGRTCHILNANQRNWKYADYIQYYAMNGNDNYSWLKNLVKQYKDLGSSVVYSIVCGKNAISGRGKTEIIKKGNLNLTKQERFMIENTLFFLKELQDVTSLLSGRKETAVVAIAYAYAYEGCDTDRLADVLRRNKYKLINCSSYEEWLKQIEDIYNKCLKSNKIRLVTKYRGEK